jgi:ribosomal protein S12 methylthiotransferase accessory factor
MSMVISFPGELRVRAEYEGLVVDTDQDGSAPAPFDLFLASLATCAGYYALAFMKKRDIDTAGSRVTMEWQRDPETRLIENVTIHLDLPQRFPEKYREAVVRAMDQCTVKRHLDHPPTIETTAG